MKLNLLIMEFTIHEINRFIARFLLKYHQPKNLFIKSNKKSPKSLFTHQKLKFNIYK